MDHSRSIKKTNEEKLNKPKTDVNTTHLRYSKGRDNAELSQKPNQLMSPAVNSDDKSEPIGVTVKNPINSRKFHSKRCLETIELEPNTTISYFSGATTVTLKDKLSSYCFEKCKNYSLTRRWK